MRKNKFLLPLCMAGCCVLAFCPALSCKAEDFLNDESVRVLRHDKRQAKVRFDRDPASARQDRWGTLFSPSEGRQRELSNPDLLRYNELPACGKADIQLFEVFEHTPVTDYFDVLYYDSASPEQAERAKDYGKTAVAYNPALLIDPKTKAADFWQNFARFVQIACLPTRFRFVTAGSKRYQEYRTGANAWDAPPPAK